MENRTVQVTNSFYDLLWDGVEQKKRRGKIKRDGKGMHYNVGRRS